MKKIFAAVLALSLLAALAGCNDGNGSSSAASEAASRTESSEAAGNSGTTNSEADPDLLSSTIEIEIVIQDYGTITAELYADTAPITVTNFVGLVNEGFYDGLTFHRIIDGFMIQGGDPNGNGSGGSGTTILGEFASNGVENSLRHSRGVLSMARGSHSNDSASSQFFIVHQAAAHLDGNYAAFGMVTDGMDVVDAIAADAVPTDNNGSIAPEAQPVIEAIRVISE